jgi:hypothetical protein
MYPFVTRLLLARQAEWPAKDWLQLGLVVMQGVLRGRLGD